MKTNKNKLQEKNLDTPTVIFPCIHVHTVGRILYCTGLAMFASHLCVGYCSLCIVYNSLM